MPNTLAQRLAIPNATTHSTTDVVTAQASGVTGLDGSFTHNSGETVTFTIANQNLTLTGASVVTAEMLATASTSDTSRQATTANNIELFLLNGDMDRNPNNGINLDASFTPPPNESLGDETFASELNEQLVEKGITPLTAFTPSLVIPKHRKPDKIALSKACRLLICSALHVRLKIFLVHQRLTMHKAGKNFCADQYLCNSYHLA